MNMFCFVLFSPNEGSKERRKHAWDSEWMNDPIHHHLFIQHILHHETQVKNRQHINDEPKYYPIGCFSRSFVCLFIQWLVPFRCNELAGNQLFLSLFYLIFFVHAFSLLPSFLPPSFLRFLSHSSLFNWNQTYFNVVIWLFSCFKASPRCRAPSSPIWLFHKLHFVFEK